MYISFTDISAEQKKPLEYKIRKAIEAIKAGFDACKHNAAIAFSGGKDSTVLWHLIRTYFPNEHPYIIFGNTGVEYPESLKFARKLGREWGGEYFRETTLSRTEEDGLKFAAQLEVLKWLEDNGRLGEILKDDGKLKTTATLEKAVTPEMWEDFRKRKLVWPKGTLKSYWWCCDQYGFPILGKAASKLDARRINIECFLKFSKSASDKDELLKYYDILRKCKTSQHCCKLIKKEPSERLQAELKVDVIFKGLMAAESRSRRTNFSTRGYLFESHRPYLPEGDSFYHCNPLQIWTDDDIWEYINRYDVPYGPLYDMGYTDSRGIEHKITRNGCYGCCTDIMFPDNHMSKLRHTHPIQWRAVMKYGMADELRKLRILKSNGQMSLIDVMDADDLLERQPCIFDDIKKHMDVGESVASDEYDAEEDL